MDPQLRHGRQDHCIYYAPDEFMVREHARRCDIPADRISAVRRMLDPANVATS